MATKAQKVRLGLFFLVAGGVLTCFLLFTAGLSLLKKRVNYLIEFSDVSIGGLRPGAAVKYQGVQIGRVQDFSISTEDISAVIVEISVEPKMAPAIREDTEAVLAGQGITGIKHIELVAGSRQAPVLAPGSTIKVGDTFLSDLDHRAEVLTRKIERVLDNVTYMTRKETADHLNLTLDAGGRLMENADRILAENRAPISRTFENLAQATESLASATATFRATMDSLHSMLTGEDAHTALEDLRIATRAVRQQLEGPLPNLIANIDTMAQNINRTVTHIDLTVMSSRNNLLSAMQELSEALQNVKEASELIREDPSVLLKGRAD
jgi:phospholipid/cholesterol/gamma-HCH transport system substrate-binding protein